MFDYAGTTIVANPDRMTLGERIRERIEATGSSQRKLAAAIGVTPQAISKLVTGTTTETPKLYQIARALKTSPEYLAGETDDPALGDTILAALEEENASVEIQEIDLAYGMGGTFVDDLPVKASTVRFTREWLRNFSDAKPDDLFFARGIGDSMMPTILDSDIVLIDRSQDTMRMNDQIWALAFGNMGMIKRLRSMPDGSLRIMSDNANVPEDRAVDDEAFLIGRVVAVVRKV